MLLPILWCNPVVDYYDIHAGWRRKGLFLYGHTMGSRNTTASGITVTTLSEILCLSGLKIGRLYKICSFFFIKEEKKYIQGLHTVT